jgi:hypothetical protein
MLFCLEFEAAWALPHGNGTEGHPHAPDDQGPLNREAGSCQELSPMLPHPSPAVACGQPTPESLASRWGDNSWRQEGSTPTNFLNCPFAERHRERAVVHWCDVNDTQRELCV